MPVFRFRALDSGGKTIEGTLEAQTRAEALHALAIQRLQPVKLEEADAVEKKAVPEKKNVSAKKRKAAIEPNRVGTGTGASLPLANHTSVNPSKKGTSTAKTEAKSHADAPRRSWRAERPLNSAQQLQFTTEIVELLEAGLQLEQALAVMENREERSALRSVASAVRACVREGMSFSRALAETGSGFSQLYLSVCAAGEASGSLEKMLQSQVEYMEFLQELRRRFVSALVYPSVVLVAGIVLLVVFITFLLPQLTTLLSKTGQQLPLVTRILVSTSEWFGKWWWTLPIGIIGVMILHRLWVRTESGRQIWDRFLLQLPLFGNIIQKQFLTQLLRSLATLTENGVNLLSSLGLVRNTFSNKIISNCLEKVSLDVAEGVPLSRAMKKHSIFPAALLDIVRIGEQTGDIAAAMRRGAEKYDREFNVVVQRFATLIQPISILLVALFVGTVAYAMITGILTTISGLRMR